MANDAFGSDDSNRIAIRNIKICNYLLLRAKANFLRMTDLQGRIGLHWLIFRVLIKLAYQNQK